MKAKVMILLGSASDINIAQKSMNILDSLGIYYDIRIASAHRTHQKVKRIVNEATNKGVEVFIGIAGLSAHLPGIIAAHTYKPVIGVPVDVKLGGLDALFAIAQMPLGAPVASVGIDRGENGAILAVQILGIHDHKLREKLRHMRMDFFSKIAADEENYLKNIKSNYYQKMSISEDNDNFKPPQIAKNTNSKVGVIAGSNSDIKVAKKITMFLDKMNINHDLEVISPIRKPEKFEAYMERNQDNDLFIAISGLSAHVTGAVVAHTEKPVIGVPCSIRLNGLDALLSMVNMPPGVPVGTMGIDAGGNAALITAEMLGIGNKEIESNIIRFKGNISCHQ